MILAGKLALVTGASRGIGRSIALALSREGARVLVHYSRSASEADEVVREISMSGGAAEKIGGDLSLSDGPHRLAEATIPLVPGKLDILVGNAGVSSAASFADTRVDEFDRLHAINVRAPYFLVQQHAPILGEGSSVIFTSSLVARAAVRNLSAYAATKGAIETLVRHLAVELGERGVRVNAIAPGVVETDMSNFTKSESGRTTTLGMQVLKQIAQPDDIAGAAAFLAGPGARWITGHIMHVDGGSKL